jgi:hypothetical protein
VRREVKRVHSSSRYAALAGIAKTQGSFLSGDDQSVNEIFEEGRCPVEIAAKEVEYHR